MKKRILSWILLLCMALTLVPAASAADIVTELTVSGIPVPRGGDKADSSMELYLNHGRLTSYQWYTSDMTPMSSSDVFSAGKLYRLVLTVSPDAGTSWGVDFSMSALTHEENTEFNLTLISKNGAALTNYATIVNPQNLKVTVGVVSEEGKETRDSVEIVPTAPYLPEAGKTPNTGNYRISNGTGAWTCRWHDNTAGKDMGASETFEAGHAYSAYFYISPDPAWEWKEKSDGKADVSVKFITNENTGAFLTDSTPSLSYEIDGTKLAVGFEFDCPAAVKTVSEIEITPKGIWYPSVGKNPTGKDDFTVDRDCVIDSAVWRDEKENSYLTASGVFESGRRYELSISLLPANGYDWDDPSKLNIRLVDGDGARTAKSFSFRDTENGRLLTAVWSIEPTEEWEELPQTVVLSGVKQPAAGQALPFDGIAVNAGEIVEITWTDTATGNWYNKTETAADIKAQEGHEYTLAVQIKPPAGNAWPYRTDENHNQWLTLPVQIKTADGSEIAETSAFVSGWAPGTQTEVLRIVVKFAKKETANPVSIEFADVGAGAWYYDWVYQAVELGLINGKGKNAYGKDYFDPDGSITLAEAVKLAACMHQLYYDGKVTLTNGYPWYASYAEYAEWPAGILVSWSGPGFSSQSVMENPNKIISRAEFAWIFSRALPAEALPVVNNIWDNSVPDVKMEGTRYYDGIYTLYRAGILNGKDERGTYYPGANIQRSEVAAIVVRMMKSDKRVGPPAKLGQ